MSPHKKVREVMLAAAPSPVKPFDSGVPDTALSFRIGGQGTEL